MMRILLLSSRFPLPARRGQQVRSIEWLEALREHDLRLLSPESPERIAPAELIGRIGPKLRIRCWADSLLRRLAVAPGGLLRGRPLQEAIFATPMARAMLRSALSEGDLDLLIIQMVRCAWAMEVCKEEAPDLPVLFDAIDGMSLHYSRWAEGAGWKSLPVRVEAKRCARREADLVKEASMVTAVARRDLDFLGVDDAKGRVIPVAGREMRGARRQASDPCLLLSGNLGYRPTVEGALYFSQKVWPRLKTEFSGLRWVLAGARPPRAIRRLSAEEGIEVFADPPGLEPFFAGADIALAPMSSGSGVAMKILEAWSAGVPVVADPWSLGGVEAPGRDAALQAGAPGEWVEAIRLLLGDPERCAHLVAKGREIWRRFYHPQVVAEVIRSCVETAGN